MATTNRRTGTPATIVGAWLSTRVVLWLVIAVTLVTIRVDVGLPLPRGAPPHLVGLLRWDSQIYAAIALHGYTRVTAAFFPLYPLLVKAVSLVVGNVYVAGAVVANTASLLALCYMHALTRLRYGEDAARRSVLYLACAPGAVFFVALYTEGLFTLCVAATLYHSGRRQWARAALFGALAAATRNTGLFLALAVALDALRPPVPSSDGSTGSPLAWWDRTSGLAAATIIPVGFLAYVAYLARTFGDPLAFIHAEASWHKHLSITNVGHILPAHVGIPSLIDLLVTLVMGLLVLALLRAGPPSAAAYAVLTFLAPLCTGMGVEGMTRYTLMLVPAFALLGHWGRRRWMHRCTLMLSLPLMVYVAVLFSHWSGPV